jgi:HEAT repeat protein
MSIAMISLWIAVGAVSFTTAVAAGLRGFGAVTGARRERYRDRVSEQLAAFAVGAGDGEPPPRPRGRLEQRVMHEELARLAPNLKGDARDLLGSLFSGYGLLDSARRDLRSDHPLAAIRAAELIGIMGVRDCEGLLAERLSADDPVIRLACARALADIGGADSMPRIVEALSRGGGNELELGEILRSFGSRAEPLLRERLQAGRSAGERRLAAVTLGEIHAASAVGDLVACLSDDDLELAARAARALGTIGDSSATEPLVSVLEQSAVRIVRVAAAGALGMLDDPRGGPGLVAALEDASWEVRDAAARALADLGETGLDAVVDAVVIRAFERAPVGLAHFSGVLDARDRLGAVIERAALGDAGCDRFVLLAWAGGVRSRLEEVAAGGSVASSYAIGVLGQQAELVA